MKLNPNFVAVFAFLFIGLIWSGGHVAWLIALGLFILLSTVIPSLFDSKGRLRRR